jgi:hypothetical protein
MMRQCLMRPTCPAMRRRMFWLQNRPFRYCSSRPQLERSLAGCASPEFSQNPTSHLASSPNLAGSSSFHVAGRAVTSVSSAEPPAECPHLSRVSLDAFFIALFEPRLEADRANECRFFTDPPHSGPVKTPIPVHRTSGHKALP